MQQIHPQQLAAWLSADDRPSPVLLDVREPWEFALCQLPASMHMPMHTVPVRLTEEEGADVEESQEAPVDESI